jgi:hypothetical protein
MPGAREKWGGAASAPASRFAPAPQFVLASAAAGGSLGGVPAGPSRGAHHPPRTEDPGP